ncbi:hypothetical protein M9458_050612 [Cirrhinus mrigala]|uniref:Tc1-like transposase DDE domain-containing protein n=1 Tax=Cirrhinus mrigala TaxID=683832 RepID=A0ABD0MY24_CIRMR
MVRVRNDIRLREIQQHILDNDDLFSNVNAISLPTIARVLKRHQRVMELDADENHHKFLFLDEAGFNLAKTKRRGWNLIGQRATVEVPGQRGANITMCAAISEDGVVGRRPCVGSYNAALIIAFLDELNQVCRDDGVTYVIVWDNVQFHHSRMVQAWFQAHPQFLALHLPPYSPFLNPIEEFFSTWRWKVYDRHPHEQVTLLQAMDDACNDIIADQCQAWIRHARRFFPRCLANENIHCDVDENLWPNPQDRVDGNIDP